MKYELLQTDTMVHEGHTLKRIKRISDGALGGYIEYESNLSQHGTCWVDKGAKVYVDAHVDDNAQIQDKARVLGNAIVEGNAIIMGNAIVHARAEISGTVIVGDDSQVFGWAKVYGNARILGRSEVSGDARVYGCTVLRDSRVKGRADLNVDATLENLHIEHKGI